MSLFKTITSEINPTEQKVTYYYWESENPEEGQEPDHTVVITLADYVKMYNLGARGVCPECLGKGIVNWVYEHATYNGITNTPTARISKCRICPVHFNGLYYYIQ